MSQVNDSFSSAKPHTGRLSKNLAVSVAVSGLTTLLEMTNIQMTENLGISIAPTVNALDAFQVSLKYHPDQAYAVVASASGDFTTPNWPVLKASGNLTGLAANAVGFCVIDTRGACAIKVEASAATGAATVDAYAGAS